MKRIIIIFCIPLFLASCTGTDKGGRRSGSDDNIVREYFANGKVKTEITVLDSLRHGPTKNYDQEGNLLSIVNYENNVRNGTVTNYYVPSGIVSSTFEYVDGVKQGDEIWFYESGKDYRVTPYVDGKMNGIQKYYYESGALMAEVPYKDNQPGKGLKEYEENGTLITDYPSIVITKEDYLATANSVLLKISLSNKTTDVTYYRGTLVDGTYLSEELKAMAAQSGVAQISFNLPKGARVDQRIQIIANYKTRFGNPYISNTSYNLQIINI